MIIGRTLQGVSNYIAVGKKPELLNYGQVNFGDLYSKSIEQAGKQMPEAMEASGQVSAYNTANLKDRLNQISPGLATTGSEISRRFSSNLGDLTQGRLPSTIGQQMGVNLRPRDLGMTSYQLTNAALQGVNNWLATFQSTAAPQQFDASNLFVSAPARAGYESQYNQQKAAVDAYNAKIKSAPSPVNVFAAQMVNALGGQLAGGGGGGGGGMDMGSIMSMVGGG